MKPSKERIREVCLGLATDLVMRGIQIKLTCDKCSKPATHNIQENVYQEIYLIDKNGNTAKTKCDFLETGENEHLCKKHFKKRMGE